MSELIREMIEQTLEVIAMSICEIIFVAILIVAIMNSFTNMAIGLSILVIVGLVLVIKMFRELFTINDEIRDWI